MHWKVFPRPLLIPELADCIPLLVYIYIYSLCTPHLSLQYSESWEGIFHLRARRVWQDTSEGGLYGFCALAHLWWWYKIKYSEVPKPLIYFSIHIILKLFAVKESGFLPRSANQYICTCFIGSLFAVWEMRIPF